MKDMCIEKALGLCSLKEKERKRECEREELERERKCIGNDPADYSTEFVNVTVY